MKFLKLSTVILFLSNIFQVLKLTVKVEKGTNVLKKFPN